MSEFVMGSPKNASRLAWGIEEFPARYFIAPNELAINVPLRPGIARNLCILPQSDLSTSQVGAEEPPIEQIFEGLTTWFSRITTYLAPTQGHQSL
jgi:hypothetical protein